MPAVLTRTPTAPCLSEPDRWATAGNDPTLKTQCQFGCPRRAGCAADALNTPNPVGIWAGIWIPPKEGDRRGPSRAQSYALARLAVIAALGSTR